MNDELSFGTAGLRAPIGPAAHQMNVGQVTRISSAVAAWLREHAGEHVRQDEHRQGYDSLQSFVIGQAFHEDDHAPKVAVGYDSRYGSHVFATTTAEVFAGAGFEVFLMPTPTPTPMIPWLVRAWGLDGGVQITASHNPSGDNGYKVYGPNGRQITPNIERVLEQKLATIPPAVDIPRVTVRPHTDLVRRYVEDIAELVIPHNADLLRINNERASITIAVTALHGVGGRAVLQALQTAGFAQIYPVQSQQYPDPTFPTVNFPSPEEPASLQALLELGAEVSADVLIALDPDADRCAVGIRTNTGEFQMLTGDETGCLLATRLVPDACEGQPRPIVASSLVSSELITHIAREHGWDLRRTLPGFKHVNAAAGELSLCYGYEEAMGFSPAPWLVDDKDGIATALIMCSWSAELKAKGLTLADELDSLYRKYGVFSGKQFALRTSAPEEVLQLGILNPPTQLLDIPLTAQPIMSLDAAGNATAIGLSLTGSCEIGDIRILARTSGTESKVKMYLEIMQARSQQESAVLIEQLGEAFQEYLAAL